jgi:hypothetical protein
MIDDEQQETTEDSPATEDDKMTLGRFAVRNMCLIANVDRSCRTYLVALHWIFWIPENPRVDGEASRLKFHFFSIPHQQNASLR